MQKGLQKPMSLGTRQVVSLLEAVLSHIQPGTILDGGPTDLPPFCVVMMVHFPAIGKSHRQVPGETIPHTT